MNRFLTTVAASALCASLAACLEVPKPQYPVSRPGAAAEAPPLPEAAPEPVQAPPAAVPQDNGVEAKPTTGIQAQPLAPPPGARTAPPRAAKKPTSSSPSPGAWLEPRYGGARLWLAAYAEPVVRQAAARDEDAVTLKKGDNLQALAKAHGVTVEDIAKANDLKPPYRVKAGDRLRLPSKGGAEPAPAKGRIKAEAAQDKPASGGGSVTVAKGDSLASISKKTGVSVDDLARVNGLQSPYKLKLGQVLSVGGEAKGGAPAKAESSKSDSGKSESASSEKASGGSVTVGKGDTLGTIAKTSGVSIEDLARINGLKKPYRLDAGQTISLGEAASDAPAKGGKAKAPEPEQAPESDATSTVTAGRHDTIQSLARQAHVSVEALARLNHLKKPYRLHRGQQIKLPEEGASGRAPASSVPPAAEATTSVKAGRGDTLASLARKHSVSVEDLASLNRLKTGAHLKRGQTIRIPGESGGRRGEAEPAPSGPQSVVAGRRDTLKSLAAKAGISVEALARANHIRPSAHIKRGQRLKLPESEASAATSYRVQGGDTLFSIARRFGTDPRTLANLNRMDASESLKVGQRLALPGGAEDQIAPKPARPRPEPSYAPPPTSAPGGPVPYSSLPSNPPTSSAPGLAPAEPLPEPSAPAPGPTPPGTASPAPPSSTPYVRPTAPPSAEPTTASDADAAAAGRGLFQWPVRGQILSGFGAKAGGQRNDGIDIAGSAGDPVRAAAAGEVVYAGNSIPGFGNLILIRHEGGWVTAYAHLANLDVKMRQTVGQGQQIGEVGQTGGVDRPLLHFEVRYAPAVKDKPRPIDPALVLPQ